MIQTNALIEKAKSSKFYLKMLNYALSRVIPFNRPHGFRIGKINDDGIEVKLPYKNSNLNHIKGLHACALATLSEFTTGLMLLNDMDSSKYRIILKSIHIDFHYQGKMDAVAKFGLTEQWIKDNVFTPLETNPSVVVVCDIKTYDIEGNHLTTGAIEWQIKAWKNVNTKSI